MVELGDKVRITDSHSEFHNRIGIAWSKGASGDGWWVKYDGGHKISFHPHGVEKVEECSADANKD